MSWKVFPTDVVGTCEQLLIPILGGEHNQSTFIYTGAWSSRLRVWVRIYCEIKLSNYLRLMDLRHCIYSNLVSRDLIAQLRKNWSCYRRSTAYEVSRRHFSNDGDYENHRYLDTKGSHFFSFLEQTSVIRSLFWGLESLTFWEKCFNDGSLSELAALQISMVMVK